MADKNELPHELVASLVLAAHAALPQSYQPAPTPTGPTWTPLAGVVLLLPPNAGRDSPPALESLVISVGTGSKVLPEARKSVHGDLVVDMHAETLAIRGARRWLADELVRCASSAVADVDRTTGWLVPDKSSPPRWRLKAGVEVWLYASDIPCGEASTAYLARQQLLNDPNMAALQASATADACQTPTGLAGAPSLSAGPVRGRAGYPRVRTLRTKPGRPDSPAAYSLSCSDKIARYGALGLQGALLSDMLEPIWLTGIVLGPVVADEDCLALEAEVTEALSGRVVREYEDERIRARLPDAYASPHPVEVHLSSQTFAHSRLALPTTPAPVPSPFCTLWIAGCLKPEKLAAGGFRLGAAKRKNGAVLATSGRSLVCKLAWVEKVAQVRAALGHQALPAQTTYHDLKASTCPPMPSDHLIAGDEAALSAGPDKKRLRLSAPADRSPSIEGASIISDGDGGGTLAYQLAKEVFRQPGRLFEGWTAANPRWEAFEMSGASGRSVE